MEFFNKMGGVDFFVGEEHATAKNEANINKRKKLIFDELFSIGLTLLKRLTE